MTKMVHNICGACGGNRKAPNLESIKISAKKGTGCGDTVRWLENNLINCTSLKTRAGKSISDIEYENAPADSMRDYMNII